MPDINQFIWDVVDHDLLKQKSVEELMAMEALMRDTAMAILQRNRPDFKHYYREDSFLFVYMKFYGFEWVDDPGCWTFAPVESGTYLRHRDRVVYVLTMEREDLRWWLRVVIYIGILMAQLALFFIMRWDATWQIVGVCCIPFVFGTLLYTHSASWPERSDAVSDKINAERRKAGGYRDGSDHPANR